MSDQRTRPIQSQHILDVITHSAAQTIRIGQRIGELLERGDLVLLVGEFGSGKTHLIKGVVQGLGSEDLVNSPSFVFINEYRAGSRHQRMRIYHADLYRIAAQGELSGIGLEDSLAGDGVCLVEWADRAPVLLAEEHLAVQLQYLNDTKRVLQFVPHGRRYQSLVEELKKTAFA